jgi:hypothetical protein
LAREQHGVSHEATAPARPSISGFIELATAHQAHPRRLEGLKRQQ